MILDSLKKFSSLLSKNQIYKVTGLIILLFLGMVLEVVGIGILIPTLEIISDPQAFLSNTYFSKIVDFLNFKDLSKLSIILLGCVIIIYFIKTVFLVFLTYKQNKFINNLNASLSNTLFKKYLKNSYSFHVDRNSSELIKILERDIGYFNPFALALFSLITEFFLCISILLTIIVIEPVGALSVGALFFLLSFIFYSFTKSRLNFWGQKRSEFEQESSKIILESLNGIREIKLYNAENFFLKNLSKNKMGLASVTTKHNTFNLLPRYYLEFISVLVIILFMTGMVLLNEPISSLITIIGIFIAAVFKMIPSINKILAALQNIKYYGHSVDIILNELNTSSELNNKENNVKHNYVINNKIKIESLSFKYDKWIIKNLNLEINKGQMIGIIGESGSGKSTLIDLITGIQAPDSGKIKIDDIDIWKDINSWQKTVGYVSQEVFLRDTSLIENIAFGLSREEINIDRINKVLKIANLKEKIDSMENGINSTFGELGVQLSGGQKQRVGIARALYNDPEILIFDESTSSLDARTEKDFIAAITNLKKIKTIIIVSHKKSSLTSCDVIYELKNKKLIRVG